MDRLHKDVSFFKWLFKKIIKNSVRRKIKWKRFKLKYFHTEKQPLDIDRQKIVDLFIALIKDKKSNLNYSLGTQSRFIESEFIWACLSPYNTTRDFIITIVDESLKDNAHSHEFIIPFEHAQDVRYLFDIESEKRFKALEFEKKKVVAVDIDKLITKIKES